MNANDLGRTETIVFIKGEDEAKLRELDAEIDRTKPMNGAPPSTLDETDAHAEALERRRKFAAAAEKRGTKVVMRSVGRKTWRRLLNEHPPREGNQADQSLGANEDAFGEAIVPACLASPTFSTEEERDAFLDSLSEAQFGRLMMTAYALNMSVGADPKARRE